MSLPFDSIWPLIAVPVVLALFLSARGGKKGAVSYPYTAAAGLFTPNEQAFLRVLEQAAGDRRVFGKVRLADVIEVRKGLTKAEWRRAFNHISQKHLDFVLCRPHDLSVCCVVELNDKTHQRWDRRERDVFLERALETAQVPLVRVPSRRSYDVDKVRALLNVYVTRKTA